jgi:hypothetical protein
MIVILYAILGYWAYGYVNSNKVYIYSGTGALFRHKLVMGVLLGWVMIPIAILKLLFGRKN